MGNYPRIAHMSQATQKNEAPNHDRKISSRKKKEWEVITKISLDDVIQK